MKAFLKACRATRPWALTCALALFHFPTNAALVPPPLGHNLTPTTHTLPADKMTLGTYALAYGLTDSLTISTSTWLDISYNMPNLGLRYGATSEHWIDRWALESFYFKTFPYGANLYKQESFMVRSTAAREIFAAYTLNASVAYQHFFNDERPFSLRMSPGLPRTPSHLSFSTLHEIYLGAHFGILGELGLAGLNYQSMYSHIGASVFARWSWLYIQLGLSRTRSFSEISDEYWYWEGQLAYESTHKVTWYHPEIQIQFYF